MIKVLVFDSNGDYIEDKIEQDDYFPQENEFACPIDVVLSFYKPKLVNGEVVECLSQEEIDALKSVEPPRSLEEQIVYLEEQNAELLLELADKEQRITELEITQAKLFLDLVLKGVL